MKLSTSLMLSVALASTAQACVRILVNEVWQDADKKTREATLWDQDIVSDYRVPYGESHGSTDVWRGNGYTVEINQYNDGGVVTYPNERIKSPTLRVEIPSRQR